MIGSRTDKDQSQPILAVKPGQFPSEAPSSDESLAKARPVRPRVLEESNILPGEASFATVKLNQGQASGAYSPGKEFLVKATSKGKLMTLALLVVLCAGATFLYSKRLPVRIMWNEDSTADKPAAVPTVETGANQVPAVPQIPPAQDSTSAHSSERVNQPAAPAAASETNASRPAITESASLPEVSGPAEKGLATPEKGLATPKHSFTVPGLSSKISAKERKGNSQSRNAMAPSESASMSGDKRRREVEAGLITAPKTGEGERRARVVEVRPVPSPEATANGSSVPKGPNSKPKVIPWP